MRILFVVKLNGLEDVLEKEREQQEQVADVLADLEEVTE